VREGHLDIVQLLLAQGADPAIINIAGSCMRHPWFHFSLLLVFPAAENSTPRSRLRRFNRAQASTAGNSLTGAAALISHPSLARAPPCP
jgi:hypothetical protein